MTAVLIVHGLGDQKRGKVTETFARSLAKAVLAQANAPPELQISALNDVQWPARVATPGCSVVTASHCDISGPPQVSVYGYHGADKRGIDKSFLVQWFVFWRLFLGLPRLGLAALRWSKPFRGRWLLTTARCLYFAAWTLIAIRVVSNIVLFLLSYTALKLTVVRTEEIQLALELPLWAVFLLFTANMVLLKLTKPTSLQLYPAIVALAATQFLTLTLEMALAKVGREPTPGGAPIFRLDTDLGQFTAAWFYAPSSFPGFWPSINFAMVLLGMSLFAIWYVIIYARSSARPCLQTAAQTERLIRWLRRSTYLVAWSILFILPLLTWFDLICAIKGWTPFAVFGDQVPPAAHVAGAVGNAAPSEQGAFAIAASVAAAFDGIREATIIELLVQFTKWISVPFILVVAGVLSSSDTRSRLLPFVTLTLDVLNYLPPIRGLDRFAVLRFLFGGLRGTTEPSLKDELRDELSTMLLAISAKHEGPVLLVAHSLGSMIALTAIDAVSANKADGQARTPFVNFVTLGSPIPLLARLFPTVYGVDAQQWNMSVVARWHNLYRGADFVGRQIGQLPHLPQPNVDDCIGAGGHAGYFTDPHLAERALGLVVTDGPSGDSLPAIEIVLRITVKSKKTPAD